MTLQQWKEKTHAEVVEVGRVMVSYQRDPELWRLDDWVVTGVACGLVWLCHR